MENMSIYNEILKNNNKDKSFEQIIKIEERLSQIKTSFLENDGYSKKEIIEELRKLKLNSRLRALLGKTQVVPKLKGNEDKNLSIGLIRDRLTHSLEVSSLAKTLAFKLNEELEVFLFNSLFNKLKTELNIEDENIIKFLNIKIKDLLKNTDFIDENTIEFISLSHDIGHPPFGHMGEKVIHSSMIKFGLTFEGNANNISSLIKEGFGEYERILYGIVKYPQKLTVDNTKGVYPEHYRKISNIVKNMENNDINFFEQFGVSYNKVPNLYMKVMEMGDDISYLTSDMEDAILFYDISFDKVKGYNKELENFITNISYEQKKDEPSANKIKSKIEKLRGYLIDNVTLNMETLELEFKEPAINDFLLSLRKVSHSLYYDNFKREEYKEVIENVISSLIDNRNNEEYMKEAITSSYFRKNILNEILDEKKKISFIRDFVASFTDDFVVKYNDKITSLNQKFALNKKFEESLKLNK